MEATVQREQNVLYGCEKLARLTTAVLHRPGEELYLINESNHVDWLFDRVPDVAGYIAEHDAYRQLLQACGVEVFELGDYVHENRALMRRLPNLTFLHDIAVLTSKGAILSAMAWKARKDEQKVVREALVGLGVPILVEFDAEAGDAFEGCLLLSHETVLVAHTERHNGAAVGKFMRQIRRYFKEVVYVDIPRARRYMHPDTIYNRVSERLAIAYLPAFRDTFLYTNGATERIDFEHFMSQKGVEIINVSDEEQRKLACTFVVVEPGMILHYDTALSGRTQRALARRGVELVLFHPEAMTAGGGSLRCHTLRLHRGDARRKPG
ncbi:MAG: arginine deiminase [Phycisphaerae bacterium]|nr:arginine deiminase [Phycisphaerae bacterium]